MNGDAWVSQGKILVLSLEDCIIWGEVLHEIQSCGIIDNYFRFNPDACMSEDYKESIEEMCCRDYHGD